MAADASQRKALRYQQTLVGLSQTSFTCLPVCCPIFNFQRSSLVSLVLPSHLLLSHLSINSPVTSSLQTLFFNRSSFLMIFFWSSLHYFSPTPTFSTHHASLLHHTKSSSCSPTKSIIFISALILPPPTPTLSFLLEQDLCNFMSTLFLQLG